MDIDNELLDHDTGQRWIIPPAELYTKVTPLLSIGGGSIEERYRQAAMRHSISVKSKKYYILREVMV